MERNDINGELQREAPLLAAMQKGNPFTVPANYFEELHQHLRDRTALEMIDQTSRGGFEVPGGYFENLGAQVLSSAKVRDIKDKAGESGFAVPLNYFENLQSKIVSKTKPAKIRSIKTDRTWLGYAAAACITVALGVGLLINQQNNSMDSKLSQISDDELVNYLQIHSDTGDFPVIIENSEINTVVSKDDSALSEKEIEQYLETTL